MKMLETTLDFIFCLDQILLQENCEEPNIVIFNFFGKESSQFFFSLSSFLIVTNLTTKVIYPNFHFVLSNLTFHFNNLSHIFLIE